MAYCGPSFVLLTSFYMSPMKKIFATLFLVLLVGAGCTGATSTQEDLSPWWLTFDLPDDWGMFTYYKAAKESPNAAGISRELNDVVIQSSTLPIFLDGAEVPEDVTEFVDEDYSFVRVFRYDSRTSVPDEAEDLGNGFFKEVEEDGDVVYYLRGVHGKYKMILEQEGQEVEDVERIILSAQESEK